VTNLWVAGVFTTIADLLEIQGEEGFKAAAYRRAARAIAGSSADIVTLAREKRLQELDGIGKSLAAKVEELLATGSCRDLEELARKVPLRVRELLELPGVGPRTASRLFRELGITSLEELETALDSGSLEQLPGLGGKRAAAIAQGLSELKSARAGGYPLGRALPWAEEIRDQLAGLYGVQQVTICGDVRRWREQVGAVELVAAAEAVDSIRDGFLELCSPYPVVAVTPHHLSAREGPPVPVELRVVPPAMQVAAVHHHTGSAAHLVELGDWAGTRGLQLTGEGVRTAGGVPLAVADEPGLYGLLGLDYIAPELREGRGEVASAAAGRLPDLVEHAAIRGDLHVHSNWSDGTASLEELAASAPGYEYVAITDHSTSLALTGGLDARRLQEQKEAIARINARHPAGPRLLAGIEVDIRRDGSLDLDDQVLAGLDVVVASIHSGLRQERETLTSRLEQAIKNPHVDIIGHPTGRLLGWRQPTVPDLDHLFSVAAATGTAFEINASPDRLDLNESWAREARSHRVKLALSSDAHSLAGLKDLRYGLGIARRAGLEAADLLNCLPLTDLLRR
jgi:DNA polymerase (family 10)